MRSPVYLTWEEVDDSVSMESTKGSNGYVKNGVVFSL
jgi:hypothetical protein